MNLEIPIIPISALKEDGFDVLLKSISDRLPKGSALFPDEQMTTNSEEFFVSEVIREKLYFVLNKELPYSLAIKIDNWEETDNCHRIFVFLLLHQQ